MKSSGRLTLGRSSPARRNSLVAHPAANPAVAAIKALASACLSTKDPPLEKIRAADVARLARMAAAAWAGLAHVQDASASDGATKASDRAAAPTRAAAGSIAR